MFEIISRVIQNKTLPLIVRKAEDARRIHLDNNEIIEVTDLGAGSLKHSSVKRKVSSIARIAAIPERYGRVLSAFASRVNGEPILELGTSLGISALYLGLGAPLSKVLSIEGCPSLSALARGTISDAGVENITVQNSDFKTGLDELVRSGKKLGLLYIDGDHRGEALLEYLAAAWPMLGSASIVILDDIHLTKDMEDGWMKARRLEGVTGSIDLLRMGILFFRDGITPLNLTIRY